MSFDVKGPKSSKKKVSYCCTRVEISSCMFVASRETNYHLQTPSPNDFDHKMFNSLLCLLESLVIIIRNHLVEEEHVDHF